MITVILGAEGCAELANAPWLRDATPEEVVAFKERSNLDDKRLRNLMVDHTGRPYWIKTLEHDAPTWAKEKAMKCLRCLRLSE